MQPDDYNKIERLQKNLYSRKNPYEFKDERTPIESAPLPPVEEAWKREEAQPEIPEEKKNTLFKKIFIVSIVFFLCCSGVAAYIFFVGLNVVSTDNVDIVVAGPVTVAGGELLPLEITVVNNNNTDLVGAELTIEYPDGARSPSDIRIPLTRETVSLGGIASGRSVTKQFESVLYGAENVDKQIRIRISYGITESDMTFNKERIYDVGLTNSPIGISVAALKEISSNQDFTMEVTLTSNSDTVTSDVVVRAEYPFGFTYKGSSITPVSGNNVWRIGSIAPQEKKTITVNGSIEGQDGEERVVRYTVGIAKPDDERTIGTEFVTILESIALKKPFVSVDLQLGRSHGDWFVGEGAERIAGILTWRNNLTSEIINAQVQIKLAGNVLDRNRVTAGTGFYRSSDNTITWDGRGTTGLARIMPGGSGTVNFSISSLDLTSGQGLTFRNPEITVDVSVRGRRVSGSDVPEEIFSTVTRNLRISSILSLDAELSYQNGPFENTGPVPPQAEEETTYTVTWSLKNSTNDLANTVVRATLPQYVAWLGVINPIGENISYNPEIRQIEWTPGQIRAGAGYTSAQREVSFQVRAEPSINQVGSNISIVGAATASALDRFTETTISAGAAALETEEKVVR